MQDSIDRRALVAGQSLLEGRKPCSQYVKRWPDRPCGDDAVDTDRFIFFLTREKDFIEPLARPDSRECNLDVGARFKPGQSDHPLRQI